MLACLGFWGLWAFAVRVALKVAFKAFEGFKGIDCGFRAFESSSKGYMGFVIISPCV